MVNRDGLQPTSDGLQLSTSNLIANSIRPFLLTVVFVSDRDGLEPTSNGLQPSTSNLIANSIRPFLLICFLCF